MKKITVSIITLALAGCASTEPVKLIAPEYKVVKIPDNLYECPTIKKFPDSDKLTNQQVGSLLIKVQKYNVVCKNSLDGIKKYINDADKTISTKK
jgi:hypothetical protein